MSPPTCAEAAWDDLRQALARGQTRARLRLLAAVVTLVSHAGRSLAAEARADLSERLAATLVARIRAGSIRSPAELLHALDRELAEHLCAGDRPSRALLVRLADSLAALPEAQRHALASDGRARRDALVALRTRLALEL